LDGQVGVTVAEEFQGAEFLFDLLPPQMMFHTAHDFFYEVPPKKSISSPLGFANVTDRDRSPQAGGKMPREVAPVEIPMIELHAAHRVHELAGGRFVLGEEFPGPVQEIASPALEELFLEPGPSALTGGESRVGRVERSGWRRPAIVVVDEILEGSLHKIPESISMRVATTEVTAKESNSEFLTQFDRELQTR
jgi:hypothetical protein